MTSIMLQGTGSNVGKSVLVAGLCRALVNRGLSVRPFKPQNMSNNAAVTSDGGEIGRAQALQALACKTSTTTLMNPVLLKPQTESGSQIVVNGQKWKTASARDYSALKKDLMAPVLQSFTTLKEQADIVVVEGAGSPAEVNLRHNDIANMGFAVASQTPVVLVGDIDRGGVIAQVVGTQAVLSDLDNAMIKGFLINKFRGDPRLFDDGYDIIKHHTGWRGLGILPYFFEASKLPAEDALDIRSTSQDGKIKVGFLQFSRIANFDDMDPLSLDPNVSMTRIAAGQPIPSGLDLVILPGSKSTRGDLEFLRAQGWDIDLFAHVRRGGHVLGICGGYQMLGNWIDDPDGSEGSPGQTKGLGLLNVTTEMTHQKTLTQTTALHCETGLSVSGYEIHKGQTTGHDCDRPFAMIGNRPDGAISPDGRITGSYLHGLFTDDAFRTHFLSRFGELDQTVNYAQEVDHTLDALADHLEAHLDIDAMLNIARTGV